jgi:hypothetical protein
MVTLGSTLVSTTANRSIDHLPVRTLVVFNHRVADLELLYCALSPDAVSYTLSSPADAIGYFGIMDGNKIVPFLSRKL